MRLPKTGPELFSKGDNWMTRKQENVVRESKKKKKKKGGSMLNVANHPCH